MSLTVKAYILRKGETNPEIRRFAVDQDVSTNYIYLRGKVTQMFPALKNKAFDLYWRDNEDDQILFSSDDELTEALGFVNDGVFKIYIKECEKSGPREQPDQSILHPGVVCDVCDGEVRGFRFKCLVCPDYDLCCSCEDKGHHPEHDMMRITTPRQTAWMGFGGMFPPPPYHDGQGPPPPPFCPPQPGAGPCGPPPAGPWGQGPFGPGGRGRGRGGHHWRRMMNRWRRWMTEGDESPDKKDRKDKKGKTEEGDKQESSKEGDVPREGQGQNESTDEEAGTSPTEDFLRNIGQNVAAMLDPLGIDVEIDVEHKGNKQTCGGTGQGGQFGPMGWATWGPAGRGGKRHGRQGGHCPWGVWTMGAPGPQSNGTSAEEKPEEKKHNDDTVEMETGETSTKPKAKTTEGQSTMDTEEVSSSAEGPTAENPPKAPSPDKDWTFVDSRSPPVEGAGQSQDGATGGLYPQVPEAAVNAPSTDPVIANALDHMSAMGFTDDGGWLTRLLEVTSGDINKALDAIRANRNK